MRACAVLSLDEGPGSHDGHGHRRKCVKVSPRTGWLSMSAAGACLLLEACSGTAGPHDLGSGGAPGMAGARGTGATGAGGATASGGATGGGGSTAPAPTLDQTGNPVYDLVRTYAGWLSTASGDAAKLAADQVMADNMITWQLPQGGFYKNDKTVYAAPWNGVAPRSGWLGANNVELGTIDNSATVTELMFLADVYRRSGTAKYRDAASKALEYLLIMPYPTGGFPQVYPERPGT